MSGKQTPIPDWTLEQFVLGELPPDQMERIEKDIAGDPELARRVSDLRESSEEILRQHPPAVFAAEVHRRAAHDKVVRPSLRVRWLFVSPALAAAAVVILLLVNPGILPFTTPDESPSTTEIRTKGLMPTLRVYRQRDESPERLEAETETCAGDVLQISYLAAEATHGVILSIDGKGSVTLHHPQHPAHDTSLGADGEVPLPSAYELDAAPVFERFFFVTATTPLSVEETLAAARSLARDLGEAQTMLLDLPESYEQSTFLVRKKESIR